MSCQPLLHTKYTALVYLKNKSWYKYMCEYKYKSWKTILDGNYDNHGNLGRLFWMVIMATMVDYSEWQPWQSLKNNLNGNHGNH